MGRFSLDEHGRVTFRTKKGTIVSFTPGPERKSKSRDNPTPKQKAARKRFVDRFAYGLGRAYAYQKAQAAHDKKKDRATRYGSRALAFGVGFTQGYRRSKRSS